MITVKVTVEVEDVDSTDEAEARVRNAVESGYGLLVRHLSWDYARAPQHPPALASGEHGRSH